MSTILAVRVENLIPRHHEAAAWIDQDVRASGWCQKEFDRRLRMKGIFGLSALTNDNLCGFIVWEQLGSSYQILNLGVDALAQRQHVGSRLIEKLIGRLGNSLLRNRIDVAVREGSLPVQLFLKHHGFRCHTTEPEWFKDTGEDLRRFSRQREAL